MRGPPPTPTAVKALRGNPGRRKLNELEPATEPMSINAPDWVEQDELVKEFWYSIGNTVRQMNVAQESDRTALELLAICLSEVRRAHDELKESGRTMVAMNGAESISPHFNMMHRMIVQAMNIMKEFGMTPAARSRAKALAMPEKKSKLTQFLEEGDE